MKKTKNKTMQKKTKLRKTVQPAPVMTKKRKKEIIRETKKKTGRQTGKDSEFAYTITDKYFPDLNVKNSSNGWWLDRRKVERMIEAFKLDATLSEVQTYAGISRGQYNDFKEVHPEFNEIIEACRQLPSLVARRNAVNRLEESYANSMDYLERKHKTEFAKKQLVSEQIVVGEMTDEEREDIDNAMAAFDEPDLEDEE